MSVRYERYERLERCVADTHCGLGCTSRLRHERVRRGYSLRQLARELSINATHLSRVERGIEGLSDRRKVQVARLFGLSVDELFFGLDGGLAGDRHVSVADAQPTGARS